VKPPIPLEDAEQKAFIQWWEAQFPTVRILHVPNGGKRSKSEAARFKGLGVRSGVPDLQVPEWHLWIEMKRQKRSYTSAEQDDWIAYLREIGDTVIVAKGWEDGRRQVLEWLDASPPASEAAFFG